MYNKIIFLLTGILLYSCKSEPETQVEQEVKEACFYSYNPSNTTLEWTAYKFTEKTPVTGTFNEVYVTAMEKTDDPEKLIESLKFSISTITVETLNDERNGKIAKLFFGSMASQDLSGRIISIENDSTLNFEVTMNEVTQKLKGTYSFIDSRFILKSSIDLMDFKAGEGIKKLNTECNELHKGKDGKSKLWSTIDLYFKTDFLSECD